MAAVEREEAAAQLKQLETSVTNQVPWELNDRYQYS